MKTIDADIKKGEFRPVYVLYGEESYLKDQYKRKLTDALLPDQDMTNFNRFAGKDIDQQEVIDLADTLPFFADHRLILIEDSGFFSSSAAKLADYLPQMPKETVLVFSEEKINRGSRLYKAAKACGGHFARMDRQDEETLRAWVIRRVRRDGKKIGSQAYERFRAMAGNDMENMAQELEKLLTYASDHEEITVEDVEAVCSRITQDQIFQMIRAITQKQQKKALDLYYDLVALKKSPLTILSLIARQYNQMAQAKDLRLNGHSPDEIARQMGLSPYAVKSLLRQSEKYAPEKILGAVNECVKAEEAVKSGKLADRLAVEMLIVTLTETGRAEEAS